MFVDCFKHDRDLCHECVHAGMCDGQLVVDCDLISKTEYKSVHNDRMLQLKTQFESMSELLEGGIQILNRSRSLNFFYDHERSS